ncbi:MAG: c-type cytochrome [Thermogutta sp.]|nr:c-type cytochrome [Thermogutta sp.]
MKTHWHDVLGVVLIGGGLILFATGCPTPPADEEAPASTTGSDDGAAATATQSESEMPAEPVAESATPAVESEAAPPAEPAPAEQQKPGPAAEAQPAAEPAAQPEMTPPAAEAPAGNAQSAAEASPAESSAAQTPPAGTPYELKIPLGLPPLEIPADNPMTVEKIELGKMLFFDKRVSKDGTLSCATCHDPQMAWAEHTPTSKGIHDQIGDRNAPTVINAAYAAAQFWDGRAATLEDQALGPVANPIEMGNTMEGMMQNLDAVPQYRELFQKVFGTGVTPESFAKAVAAFERTVLSGDSPYDRFKAGQEDALTDAQKRGLELFENSGCADCHTPPLFSSYDYYNAGVGMDKEKPDQGRKAVTGEDYDMGAFRVPSLREVANTGPYFHDGSVAGLEEAVALMAAGGKDNPHRSVEFDTVREAKLTPEQQKDIVEFLKALSGTYPMTEPPQLP